MPNDIESRLRAAERTLAEWSGLSEEVVSLREKVHTLSNQMQPLLLLSERLSQLVTSLNLLEHEIASLKGKFAGAIIILGLFAPILSALVGKLLH